MFKIGKRTMKTAIAIFICTMLSFLIHIINKDSLSALYSPFFGAIAAGYSVHPDRKSSFKMAKNRSIGTLIGGTCGIILLTSLQDFRTINNFNLFIYYSLVAVGSIVAVQIANKLHQKTAVFVTILTFSSVTLGGYEMTGLMYGINRTLSTLIGVGIALLVNVFELPKRKNNEVMFFCEFDEMINSVDNGALKFKLNRLLENHLNIVLNTNYLNISHYYELSSLENNLMVLDGVARYNFQTRRFDNVYNITLDDKNTIYQILNNYELNVFEYVYIQKTGKIRLFHGDVKNQQLLDKVYELNRSGNCVYGKVIDTTPVCKFLINGPLDVLKEISKQLTFINNYITRVDDDFYLNIVSNDATIINQFKSLNINKQLISYCYPQSVKLVEKISTKVNVIGCDNNNYQTFKNEIDAVKNLKNIYYKKRVKKNR